VGFWFEGLLPKKKVWVFCVITFLSGDSKKMCLFQLLWEHCCQEHNSWWTRAPTAGGRAEEEQTSDPSSQRLTICQ